MFGLGSCLMACPTSIVGGQVNDDGPLARRLPGPPLPAQRQYDWFHGTVETVGNDTITVSRPAWVSYTWMERGPDGQQIERKLIEPAVTRRVRLSPELLAGGYPRAERATPIGAPFGEWDKNTHRAKDVKAGDIIAIWCPKQEVCEAICITARPFGRIPRPPAGGTYHKERNAHWDRVEQGLPHPGHRSNQTWSEAYRELAKTLEGGIKFAEDLIQSDAGKNRLSKIDINNLNRTIADDREKLAEIRERIKVLEGEEKTAPPPRRAGDRPGPAK
jgi:hypothetical protein